MFIHIIITSFVLTLVHSRCSLKNVEVHSILIDGSPLVIDVTGCLERKAFLNGNITRNVLEIDINGQDIPNLKKDTIKHLIHLRKIAIRNTNLKQIESQVFRNVPKLQVVEFTSNKIKVIEKGTFDAQNFENISISHNDIASMKGAAFSNMNYLKILNISHNKLNVFHGSWFVGLPNLTSIDLRHNQIVAVPQKAFENIPNITEIYFSHNNIISVEPNAFEGLHTLKCLDLKYNLLKTLNVDSFPPNIQINTLYINANRFNFLKTSLIEGMNLDAVIIDGNPWNCFCYVKSENEFLIRNTRILPSVECARSTAPICVAAYVVDCQEEDNEDLTTYYYKQIEYQDNSNCTRK